MPDKTLTTGHQAELDDFAVDHFAGLMKKKLAIARAKGRGGWNRKDECSQKSLSNMLHVHTQTGDPVDVANFCMFLAMRHEAILSNEESKP